MEEQGAGRAINRHRFSLEEAEANLERPVVRALLQLMRFRNTHPAFNGQVLCPPIVCLADAHVFGRVSTSQSLWQAAAADLNDMRTGIVSSCTSLVSVVASVAQQHQQ